MSDSEANEAAAATNIMDPGASGASNASLVEQLAKMQQVMELQFKTMNMQAEMLSAKSTQSTLAVPSTIKQVKVPEGRYDMTLGEFRTFEKDCHDYKTLTQYNDAQIVLQLRMNMDSQLKSAIDVNYRTEWDKFTLKQAIAAIGKLINQISNPVVYRKDFDNLYQGAHETIQEFVTKLRACAIDCNFVCPFDTHHDLTNYHIINKLRSGIYDKNLQQELLVKHNEHMDLKTIIEYCEQYESAKKDKEKLSFNKLPALSGIDGCELSEMEIAAAISTYKKSKRTLNRKPFDSKKCNYCGYDKHAKIQCPAQGKKCNYCGKMDHFEQVCRSAKLEKNASAMVFSSIEKIVNTVSKSDLPILTVNIQVNEESSPVSTEVIADTGAQVCVAGPSHMKHLKIRIEQLKEPTHILKHAGGNPLKLLGTYPVNIWHNDRFVNEDIYFAAGVPHMYISLDICKKIGLIHPQFPHVQLNNVNIVPSARQKTVRQPPLRPTEVPFEPIVENIPKLEMWFLKEFSSTTFNISDELPVMSGPPYKFHLVDEAMPYAAHTPIPIPHHWKAQVRDMLESDIAAGILQRVPIGEPTEWCMRMVTVEKKNNEPRRTIDYQPINKFCKRETHHTPPPIDVISNIPSQCYKTVLDAFNGYHQIPLDKESVKLTTFITEFGRFQYLRAPQGHYWLW